MVRTSTPADHQLEQRIGVQVVAIIGVLAAAGDREHPKPQHGGQAADRPRRTASRHSRMQSASVSAKPSWRSAPPLAQVIAEWNEKISMSLANPTHRQQCQKSGFSDKNQKQADACTGTTLQQQAVLVTGAVARTPQTRQWVMAAFPSLRSIANRAKKRSRLVTSGARPFDSAALRGPVVDASLSWPVLSNRVVQNR